MNNQKGLTLVELMVTVAVLVTLLAVGVPMVDRMTASSRSTGATNAFVAGLRLARVESINRAKPTTLCALASRYESGTPGACATGVPNWGNGFRVFIDDDASGTAGVYDAANERELRLWTAFNTDITLAPVNEDGNQVRAFRFSLLGEAFHFVASNNAIIEKDVLADITHSSGGTKRRCVQVLSSGLLRTYVQPDSGKTCNDSDLL